VFFSCSEEQPPSRKLITENVIVIIIDGARYSETWGDTTHQYMPFLHNNLSKCGTIYNRFYNNGPTYTLAGHVSVTTGIYQEIDNSGKELPKLPSYIQKYNFTTLSEKERSWIIASKDKLEVLSNTLDTTYFNKNMPSANCGINGLGSGYRTDSITFKVLMETLSIKNPRLVLVNFSEPDYFGHGNNWEKYIQSIKNADQYIYRIWEFIQTDSFYKDKTALFVTNDHGRHLDGVADGFVSHGDGCEGCRHLMFYASGPNFKTGVVLENKRELIDIPSTIYNMLKLDDNLTQGKIMEELFE
jgi:predicted AlkP superfamily pyrophosphatase or phosphodiesterase